MSLVVWSLWVNTRTWDISPNNINIMYSQDQRFIFVDQYLLSQNKVDTIFSFSNSIKRLYLDYPYIHFISRNVDTPFFSFNLETKKFKYYDIVGTFSDFSVISKFLLASSNYSDSKSYNFKDSISFPIYGYRVIAFSNKELYIDKNNNLREIKTNQVIMENVLNISSSMNYLVVFKPDRAIIFDNNFNKIKEILGSFLDGFLIDIDGDNKDEFIAYDNFRIYLYRDSDMELISSLKDSINCIMILDYNKDGSYDLLVSTKKELKLFEQMPKTKLEINYVDYSIINTKCGCLSGMFLVYEKPIKPDPFSVKIKYKLNGIEFSVDNKEGEFITINLLDTKGSFIRTIYSGKFKGINNFNIENIEKGGVYIISIKGEKNEQKVSFIWNKK